MITAKFGGTAVTATNLHCLKNILTPNHRCVVVSAIGREHPNDTKVTDLLKSHYLGDQLAWDKICQKYRRLVEVNGINCDVDKLLFSARSRSLAYDLAYCMSLGEELAGKLVAQFLGAEYLEAQDLIVFNGKRLAESQTFRNIRSAFSGPSCGVVGGFYGGCNTVATATLSPTEARCVRQTFSRGGGDVTGAICAAATGSTLYENWTDVYGVCLADPKSISGVVTARNLSYHEMQLLAENGAQVLHPQAVNYVQKCAIPIKIGNYLNPQGASTLVSNCPSGLPLLLSTERVHKGAYLTTVLFNLPTQKAVQLLGEVFCRLSANTQKNVATPCCNALTVYYCNVTNNRAEILTSRSILKDIYKTFASQV